MNILFYFIILAIPSLLTLFHYKTAMKYIKFSGIALIIVFLIAYMQNFPALFNIYKLQNSAISANKAVVFYALILYWFTITSIVLVSLYHFYRIKILNAIIAYFVTPTCLLLLISFHLYSRAIIGADVLDSFSRWNFLLALQTGLLLGQVAAIWLKDYRIYRLQRQQIPLTCLIILGMLLFNLPMFAIYGIFGNGFKTDATDFNQGHRLYLYICILIPFALYYIFRKREYQVKHFAMVYISLATMISYLIIFPFPVLQHPNNWPLHLCNTAMFVIPLSIIFKMNRLFYFTFFINIFGAFVAILMPNYTFAYMFEPRLISYWINHAMVFFMPFLLIELGIFVRPKRKQFFYSVTAFSCYFSIILIFNAWFSNYGSTDYFFLNSNFIVNKLGFGLYKTRQFTWIFKINNLTFTFYPIYQSLFFFTYILLSLMAWFIYENAYQVIDNYGLLNIKRKAFSDSQQQFNKSLKKRKDKKENSMIKIIDFGKKYSGSDRFAARHVNLEIKEGEIFAFLGHNGAGKSTLIKSLVGIQPISEGKIEVNGYDIEHQSVAAKQHIGFVPDHYALYERLTGREYVNYVADLYNVSKSDRDERINYYINLFELKTAFDAQIKTYSHGMKQKVAIIAALVHEPKVWILDEPLTGLDPSSVYQVKRTLKEYAQKGNAVFFSSHLLDFVATICDRFAIIKSGTILAIEDIDIIKQQNISLEQFYIKTTNLEPGK